MQPLVQPIDATTIFPVTCHTNHVGTGSTFVAIQGKQQNGTDYICQALEKGARTIVVAHATELPAAAIKKINECGATLQYTDNPRRALAELSAQALGYPARSLRILSITGTKGKTTSAFLLEHLLKSLGYKTALLSTVTNRILETKFPTTLTTQHPDYLHYFFAQCIQVGVDYVVMETSAQAFTLERVHGIRFDGAIFTNLDQEHAEFYATMEEYFTQKARIFEHLKSGAPAVTNADNSWCQRVIAQHPTVLTMSSESPASCYLSIKRSDLTGLEGSLTLHNHEYMYSCSTLFGTFNAYNIAGCITLLDALGINTAAATTALTQFPGVPGRLNAYTAPNGARCFIDYAANPSSFTSVLSTLTTLSDHIIAVFGAGGDRDPIKRPIMGMLAAQYAALIIVTTDNPRSEEVNDIIRQIVAGVPPEAHHKLIIEPDREAAIKIAYAHSTPTSIIALLGKGPDEYQLVKGVKIPFSEAQIIRALPSLRLSRPSGLASYGGQAVPASGEADQDL